MSTQIQHRRGTTAQHSSFTGALGEITVDTDKNVLVVHDGLTVGGIPSARNDMIQRTAVASGTNTYTATLVPALLSYVANTYVLIKFTNAATLTNPTINLNTVGALTLVKNGNAALAIGDIPAGHVGVLYLDGVNAVLCNPAGSVSSVAPGTVSEYAGWTAPTGYLLCYGQAVLRSTYAVLMAAISRSVTVTMTIASPCVVTDTGSNFAEGDPWVPSTTGALPTGLTAGTTYYIKSPTANSFNLSAAPFGAAINTTGTQSGVHTGSFFPHGNGDGSTTFNVPDKRGRGAVGKDNMGGTSANRITVGGSGINGGTLGASGGAETVALTTAQNAAHTHAQQADTAINNTSAPNTGGSFNGSNTSGGTTGSSGSGSAHQNTSPSLMMNFIIKT